MKSASITDLDLQGHPGSPTPEGSTTGRDGLRPHWREMLQDTVAAIAISAAVVCVAYFYWGA